MALKIYKKNNYCVVDDGTQKKYFSGDEISLSNSGGGNWTIINSSKPSESISFHFSVVQDESGTPVGDQIQVEEYLTLNTNFSGASGGGAAWGSITGTLSEQSDIQSALDDKQETLISSTNIKTINGTSVLGSGDLTVGGGGAPATSIFIEPKSDRYYGITLDGHSASNLTYIGAGQMNLTAFTPAHDLEINAIVFVAVQTAVAGGLLKVVIYSNSNGQPNTKLFESATVSADTTGMKFLQGFNFTFNANETYWISTVANDSINVRALDTYQQYPLFPVISNSAGTNKNQAYYYQANFNSLPTTMPIFGESNYSGSRIPMITFRKS